MSLRWLKVYSLVHQALWKTDTPCLLCLKFAGTCIFNDPTVIVYWSSGGQKPPAFLSRHSLTCISVIRSTKKSPRHSVPREIRAAVLFGRMSQNLIPAFHSIQVLVPASCLTVRYGTPGLCCMSKLSPQLEMQAFYSFWEAALTYS